MTLRTGSTLSHYRLVEKIGEGGMGVVYRALDTRLKRHVAIKVLPAGMTTDAHRRRRFLHEAKAAAAVTHARIATVHEVDERDGSIFIVMELVQGQSLRSLMRNGPLPIPQALRIASEIADGLAHAHEAHIVHRDLKPENVAIDREGHAKILDFGLARLVEPRQEDVLSQPSAAETASAQLTGRGQILGTTAYMSPEQARGAQVDARSDLFSMGIVLYEMVTGRRPFEGATPIETLSAILKDEPLPASRRNPEVPADLDAVLERCLKKDPAARPESAGDLRHDLERIHGAQGTPASNAAFAAGRPTRRHARMLLVGASVAAVLAVTLSLVTLAVRRARPPAPVSEARIQSLAVLPLRNLSGDPQEEYFADGVTDELITHLSRIGTLRVVSRSSSMRYKGASKNLPDIARELNVEALVEGSVQRSSDRVRVSASLVRASSDSSLWAESYERDLRDVLALQSDVAGAIAKVIQARLTPQEEARLTASRPVDPEAYRHTLMGRHERDKSTRSALQKALEEYQAALDRDPGYAPAYVGIADVYETLSSIYMSSKVALPKARAAAQRAIELDDSQAEAYSTLGLVAAGLDHDWPAAEAAFRRALELNPGNAITHNSYGLFLSYVGRTEDSIVQMDRAQELDPLSPWVAVGTAWPFIFALPGMRDYRRAVSILEGVIETDPSFVYSHLNLAVVLSHLRQCDRAMREARTTVALSDADLGILVAIGDTYATCGERSQAEEILRRVHGEGAGGRVSPFFIAQIHAALGDRENALHWLGIAEQEADQTLITAMVAPGLDSLRSDPRFVALLRRLNLPPREAARTGAGASS